MKNLFLLFFLLVNINTFSQVKIIPADRNLQTVKEPSAKEIAFRLSNFNGLTLPSSGETQLSVGVKEFDLGNNCRGNTFVAPDNGVYHFDVRLNFSFAITDYANFLRFHLSLLKGSQVMEKTTLMNAQTPNTPFHTLMISTTIALAKGDVVSASFSADANPGTGPVNASTASFSGFKVADLTGGGTMDRIR